MDVGLNVGQRLVAISVLPKEGNFVTIRMIRTLISKLGLSAEEITSFEVAEVDGEVRWNDKGSVPKSVSFADAEIDLIKKSLKKLDEENKLNQDTFLIYEKFCA